MKERIRYYKSFDDDFFADGESVSTPEGYKWIRRDALSAVISAVIYSLAITLGTLYSRLFLHMHVKGARKLRQHKGGFFLYANHTQPIGDVVNPGLVCFPKRVYTVVSPANLALPVLGKILPYLGALPIPDSLGGMRDFSKAIKERADSGHPVIIYPEAHLWEYYTGVRPFNSTSFSFPVRNEKDSFVMTSTYQKRRFGKRPRLTVYIDGPFVGEGDNPRVRSASLERAVTECMTRRSRESNCEYIKYVHCADAQ